MKLVGILTVTSIRELEAGVCSGEIRWWRRINRSRLGLQTVRESSFLSSFYNNRVLFVLFSYQSLLGKVLLSGRSVSSCSPIRVSIFTPRCVWALHQRVPSFCTQTSSGSALGLASQSELVSLLPSSRTEPSPLTLCQSFLENKGRRCLRPAGSFPPSAFLLLWQERGVPLHLHPLRHYGNHRKHV